MVRHDIEHLSEPIFFKCRDKLSMRFGAAELLIDLVRVHHIVTMGAARSCLQVRRAVEMADAERRQVIPDRRGLGKTEACVQLNAVSATNISGHDGALSVIVTQR